MAQVKKVSPLDFARGKQVSKKWIFWIAAGIIFFISLTNLSLLARNEVAKVMRAPTEREIAKWQEIVKETPTYRDGYLKLVTLYWKLKDEEKTKEMLDRAAELDPNYEGTKELRKNLGY